MQLPAHEVCRPCRALLGRLRFLSADATLIRRLPRHLKRAELRVFVAVMEHRSVRKAAAVLHLTQPAVTRAIASLEALLSVPLFDRTSHGVEPTVHGPSFAPRADAVFDEPRRAAQDLAAVRRGEQGILRVGVLPMPAIPFLPVAVGKLTDAQPDVLVTVVEARETELMERLHERDLAGTAWAHARPRPAAAVRLRAAPAPPAPRRRRRAAATTG
ncbi:MAG: LysR family transcriptional regulator [Burkholderiales bacterium]